MGGVCYTRVANAALQLRSAHPVPRLDPARERLRWLVRAKGSPRVSTSPPTTDQILAALASAPPHIAALTAGLEPAQLRTAPEPDAWSANDVLAHLRACADMWGNAIVAIIEQDAPTLRAVNPRTWIKQTDYPEQAFRPSLRAFTAQRAELVARLEPLTPAGWARTATVAGAGKALERTVQFYAEWLVNHERPHLKQIERIVDALRS